MITPDKQTMMIINNREERILYSRGSKLESMKSSVLDHDETTIRNSTNLLKPMWSPDPPGIVKLPACQRLTPISNTFVSKNLSSTKAGVSILQ